MKHIDGLSELTKAERMTWFCNTHFTKIENAIVLFERYQNADAELQKPRDKFIENTVSNYYLPFAVAPNSAINGRIYTVSMVIEESSAVTAASRAAKYWQAYEDFHTEMFDTQRMGHVHFFFYGEKADLTVFFARV